MVLIGVLVLLFFFIKIWSKQMLFVNIAVVNTRHGIIYWNKF